MKLDTNVLADSLYYELGGDYQIKNANTILHAVRELRSKGFNIKDEDLYNGFEKVKELTGLRGRWKLYRKPRRLFLIQVIIPAVFPITCSN